MSDLSTDILAIQMEARRLGAEDEFKRLRAKALLVLNNMAPSEYDIARYIVIQIFGDMKGAKI